MSAAAPDAAHLLTTPLHALHRELGARMVPFAGYDMPVQYPAGILAEHRHCREAAALFDVSHMGQVRLLGSEAAAALESLVPVDVLGLAAGRQRYAFFTNAHGGLLDDLMIAHRPSADGDGTELFLVVNAGCKEADIAHLRAHIGVRCTIEPLYQQALLALQGPAAASVLAQLDGAAAQLRFMDGAWLQLGAARCFVTRSGYTGEDGYEISVPAAQAEALARALLAQPAVRPAGLGARDTLRLEAGLCLYGHDIDADTTAVEAGLSWAIQKVRRPGGARAGGYPGAERIAQQLAEGADVRRVGLVSDQRIPVREGAALVTADGQTLGRVTSGTVSPSLGHPIAMGYLPASHAAPGTPVQALVRDKPVPMRVSALPFVPHRYHRG